MGKPQLGHVRIEIMEGRTLLGLGKPYWWWRTRYVRNGEVGIHSETFNDRRDCETSIRAHRHYLGSAEVRFIRPDGRPERVPGWYDA